MTDRSTIRLSAPEQSKPSYMLVRVHGDPRAAASAIRAILREIDPQMATTVEPLASMVERQGERLKPVIIQGAIAGSLALLLALTGVYGVVSFSISQRTREIGIRVALGAQRSDVVSLVMRSGAAPVCGGLLVGIVLAAAVSAGMESAVFGLKAHDPLTLIIVSLLLFGAALVAIWIPARRASGIDPLASLRHG
jgi:putative ABC transport system permease protein